MAPARWLKPHAWNSGAAIIVDSSACSGIFENSAAAGPSELGVGREAPLGVPVVPEVRITALPISDGATTGSGSPSSMSSSSVGSESLRFAVGPGHEALAPAARILDEL